MSGLSKDLLVFDAANPDTSDNVGAYIRGASGEIVTSTLSGSKQALDVNMVNELEVNISASGGDSVLISDGTDTLEINPDGSINAVVSATDLDIRNLAFATDKVDVSGSTVALDAGTLAALETITVLQGTDPWIVSATDLDIRDLAFATDKVDVSGSTISVSGDVNVTQGTSPWVVSATDLDIRNLSAAQDNVAISDGSDTLAINADGSINTLSTVSGNVADDAVDSGNPLKVGSRAVSGPLAAISAAGDRADMISDLYRRIYMNDSANIALLASNVAVADTAVLLVASALGGRREFLVQNLASQPIYIGHSGVSTSNGTRIAAGASGSFKIGPNVALYAISANATSKDVRVLELA